MVKNNSTENEDCGDTLFLVDGFHFTNVSMLYKGIKAQTDN